MRKRSLKDLAADRLKRARVIVRADFNVPLDEGEVADDTRIRETLPTLRTLVEAGSRTVVLSHLGRPEGGRDPTLSLRPVGRRLADLLDTEVRFVEDLAGEQAREAVDSTEPGQVLLLENTRFHPGETKGDEGLARTLATYGDLFVNDAFGSAHRAHASTTGVARLVRAKGGEAVAGFLMEKELEFLGRTLEDPERPFVAILGGAKISGKIDVIQALLPRVDRLLVGGAMANTFLRALGLETGDSLVEDDRMAIARELLDAAGERLLLPLDCTVADSLEPGAAVRTVARDAVAPGEKIGDIGPRTRELFEGEIAGARTVVWNGPMGVFELGAFRTGTMRIATAVAGAGEQGALTVVGGGDSASAVVMAGVADHLSHVSTGGGASLEFLAGAELPGVAALSDA